jgi:glucose/mannose-6-phosphate isomerase
MLQCCSVLFVTIEGTSVNLDDNTYLKEIDTEGMLAHVEGLPEQFQTAWEFGLGQSISESFRSARQVIICGMGGSAIGGDLLGGLMNASGTLPVTLVRGYQLPAWAKGPETLVITSSFSGNTEETLAAYADAAERGLNVLAITTGGKLAKSAQENGHTVWQFAHKSPPRAALGWSLGILLALAHQLGWLEDLEPDVAEAVRIMQSHRPSYGTETPAAQNPAKRQAGQFIERLPVIYGAGAFEVVARRWKTQFNENTNQWAFYEPIPEMNHNGIVGIEFPQFLISKIGALFLRSNYDHPRVALRYDLTKNLFLEVGIPSDSFEPDGNSLLAQMMHAILYGDYITFYAAIAQGVNPTTIWPIDQLKEEMAKHA